MRMPKGSYPLQTWPAAKRAIYEQSRVRHPQRGFPLLPRYGCVPARKAGVFSEATRYLIPGYQEAVDLMVDRLTQFDAGEGAPKPGEAMPPFVMPDEKGQLVTLDELLMKGPLAITFHRGHWCRKTGLVSHCLETPPGNEIPVATVRRGSCCETKSRGKHMKRIGQLLCGAAIIMMTGTVASDVHARALFAYPLRTCSASASMSAKCHKRTWPRDIATG